MPQRQHENKTVSMVERLLVFLQNGDCPENMVLIKCSHVIFSTGCVSGRAGGICASQGKYLELVHNHS